MANAATMPTVSVPSPRLGRGPGSAPSPDPDVPFLDRARAAHFAEITEGLRVSRASRDATVESLRAKRAAGDALTVGERAVLEVDRRCVARTSRRAALQSLTTLDARLARWDARGFGADPRFGDAALESCRARLATAKEDATRTVAAAQPAIAEARRRARERERAALETRLEASKRRQREDRYAFDAELAAARRTERVERELDREHARERDQRMDLENRRDARREHRAHMMNPSVLKEAPSAATDHHAPFQRSPSPTSRRADRPTLSRSAFSGVLNPGEASASADASSSAFLDDTDEAFVHEDEADVEQQRAAWNAELQRRRAALDEERATLESASLEKRGLPQSSARAELRTENAAGTKSGFVVPARRRGAVLASLLGHALEIEVSTSEASRGLDLAVSDVSDAVAPELVAKALVAAESGAAPGDARLGAHAAVARAAANAVLRAVDPGDPHAPVPRAFCYGGSSRGLSGDTYMTFASEAGADTKHGVADGIDGVDGARLRRDDALCALKELRATQTPVGAETFDAVFAYFARLAERRALDVFKASSAMAERLAPPPTGVGAAASRAHAAAKTRLARLVRGLFACDDLEAAPAPGHAPFWASRASKARHAAGAVAEKARATRPVRDGTGIPAKRNVKQEKKDETRDDARAALEPGVPAEQDARAGAGSSEVETSAPLGSLLGALDLSLAEPRGGALETNPNANANPNANPFRPSGAAARGGKRRLNLRASAAFGSLAARTPAETADESDESDDELEAALRALPSSAGAGSRDVLRRASTDPETGGNAAETALPKLDAAESTAAEDSKRFESSPRSSGALSASSPPRRRDVLPPSRDSDAIEAEDVPPPSEPSADVSRSPLSEPSRVTDRGGERKDGPIDVRSTNARPPPVFSPDASATFSESDFDLGSPFSPAARGLPPAAVPSRQVATSASALPGGPRRRPLSRPREGSAVGSIVSRALADDSDSSASDASRRVAGDAARDAFSGAPDESDSFDF